MRYIGIVEKGKGMGITLGFPTANIPLHDTSLSGIYAGLVEVTGKQYHAAIYADQRRGLLESYLFDFTGDLYGKEISVELLEKVREDQVFTDMESLIAQIAADVTNVKAYFDKTPV